MLCGICSNLPQPGTFGYEVFNKIPQITGQLGDLGNLGGILNNISGIPGLQDKIPDIQNIIPGSKEAKEAGNL